MLVHGTRKRKYKTPIIAFPADPHPSRELQDAMLDILAESSERKLRALNIAIDLGPYADDSAVRR